MAVHSALGNGFQEVIYQKALKIEMNLQGLSFTREQEMPIYYKGIQIGTRRVDFLVEEVICVELKALIELQDVHLAQAINYLEAYDLEVGLLINFGAKSLQFKRLANKSFKQKNQGNLHSLSDTKPRKNIPQQVVRADLAGDLAQVVEGAPDVHRDEVGRDAGLEVLFHGLEAFSGLLEGFVVTGIA